MLHTDFSFAFKESLIQTVPACKVKRDSWRSKIQVVSKVPNKHTNRTRNRARTGGYNTLIPRDSLLAILDDDAEIDGGDGFG